MNVSNIFEYKANSTEIKWELPNLMINISTSNDNLQFKHMMLLQTYSVTYD